MGNPHCLLLPVVCLLETDRYMNVIIPLAGRVAGMPSNPKGPKQAGSCVSLPTDFLLSGMFYFILA